MPFLAFVPADLEDLLNNARGREKMLSLQPREQIMLVYMALDIVHAAYVGFFRFLTEAVYIAVEQDTVDRGVDMGDLCSLWEEYQNSRQELVSRVLFVWIHITHLPPPSLHCAPVTDHQGHGFAQGDILLQMLPLRTATAAWDAHAGPGQGEGGTDQQAAGLSALHVVGAYHPHALEIGVPQGDHAHSDVMPA